MTSRLPYLFHLVLALWRRSTAWSKSKVMRVLGLILRSAAFNPEERDLSLVWVGAEGVSGDPMPPE